MKEGLLIETVKVGSVRVIPGASISLIVPSAITSDVYETPPFTALACNKRGLILISIKSFGFPLTVAGWLGTKYKTV